MTNDCGERYCRSDGGIKPGGEPPPPPPPHETSSSATKESAANFAPRRIIASSLSARSDKWPQYEPDLRAGGTGTYNVPRRERLQRRWPAHQARQGFAGLPFNAVVRYLAFDAPGVNVLALTDAVRFRQLERARFASFVHSGLTRTRKRSVVRGRKVCASGDESRTTQNHPFHARVSRVYRPNHTWPTRGSPYGTERAPAHLPSSKI